MRDRHAETHNLIEELLASGRFANREEVVGEAVRLLRDELKSKNGQNELTHVSAQDWCAQFEAWAASHRPLPHEADDRRESIYEGRGE